MPSGREDSSQLAFFSPLGDGLANLVHTKCNTTDLLFLCVMTMPGVSYVISCVSLVEILGSKDKEAGRIFFSHLHYQDKMLGDAWRTSGWGKATAVHTQSWMWISDPAEGTFKQHLKNLIDLFFFLKHPWSSTWKLNEVVYNTENLAQDYLNSCLLNPCFCLTKISLVIMSAPVISLLLFPPAFLPFLPLSLRKKKKRDVERTFISLFTLF